MLDQSFLFALIELARSESIDELLDHAVAMLERVLNVGGRIELFDIDGTRLCRGALRADSAGYRTWIGIRYTIGAIYLDAPPPDPAGVELLAVQLAPAAQCLLAIELSQRRTLREEIEQVYERRIRDALIRSDWNASAVARELNVGRGRVARVVQRWRMR